MADVKDWRDAFCGRKDELAALVSCYAEVAAGKGPRLVVVLGDRGMGKTRLVQELYRVLTTRFDPANYWPDANLFAGNNLRVAPDLSDESVRAHYSGFQLADRPMPFLWWGFRLSDPDVRNAARSDMSTHRATLDPHLTPLRLAEAVNAARARMLEAGIDAASELGKNLLKDAVKAIPGIGIAATVIEHLIDYAGKAKAAAAAAREESGIRTGHKASDLVDVEFSRLADLNAKTLDELASLLAPMGKVAPLPIVVFCDDAQFARAGGDEGAMHLLKNLWERAHLANWPLMVVLTHWAVEWHRAQSNDGSLAGALLRSAQSPQFGSVLDLPKESSLAQLVLAGLPGLAQHDVSLLLKKADGNPQALIELIDSVRRAPAWRRHGGSALTEYARTEIDRSPTELSSLILHRLQSEATPESVRQAVALSSLQGMEFLRLLTYQASEALDLGTTRDSLSAAESPHRLVVSLETGLAGFVQRAYREAAMQLISAHVGDPQAVEDALLTTAISLVGSPDRWGCLQSAEQSACWGVIVGLAQNHADAKMRLFAGRGLLWLIEMALRNPRGPDCARAAELAMRFEQGLGERWTLESFGAAELFSAIGAISAWEGEIRAENLTKQVLKRQRQLASKASDPEHLSQLSHALILMATVAKAKGDWDSAEESGYEALHINRELAMRVGDADDRSALVAALYFVGSVAQERGEWSKAREAYQESLDICRKESRAPRTPQSLKDESLLLEMLGGVAMDTRDLAAAEAAFRESLKGYRQVASDAGTPASMRAVAGVLVRVGILARAKGDLGEAEAAYRESLTISRSLAEQLQSPGSLRDVSVVLEGLGRLAHDKGLNDEAENFHREALQLRRDLLQRLGTPWELEDVVTSLLQVGLLVVERGNLEEAESIFGEGLDLCTRLINALGTPKSLRARGAFLEQLAKIFQKRSDWASASSAYREALGISRDLWSRFEIPIDLQHQSRFSLGLGHVAWERADLAAAEKAYQGCLELSRQLASRFEAIESLTGVSDALFFMGMVHEKRGDLSSAETALVERLSIDRRLDTQMGTPPSMFRVAASLSALGDNLKRTGNLKQAYAAFHESAVRSRECLSAAVPHSRALLSLALFRLGEISISRGDISAATVAVEECVMICREQASVLGTSRAHRSLACVLALAGILALARGDSLVAEVAHRESWRVHRQLSGPEAKDGEISSSCELMRLLSQLAMKLGHQNEALDLLTGLVTLLDSEAERWRIPTAIAEAEEARQLLTALQTGPIGT